MKSSEKKKPWHQYEHVVFDIDGTLLNSNLAHVWAWQDAIEREHLFVPHLTLFMQMGLPGKQIVEKYAFSFRDKATAQRIAESAGRLYSERYVKLIAPFDGAYRLLSGLKRHGRKLHAITSASRPEAESMLNRFKLGAFFTHTLTGEETGAGKPTIEPFSCLKEKIGARAELISIGDSPFDLKASESAGVPFVYLGHGGFPREWFARAHSTFFNINEMLAALIKTMGSKIKIAA